MNYSIIYQKYGNSTEKFLKNVEKLYDTLDSQESLSEVFEGLYTLGKEFICDIAKNFLESKDSDLRKASKLKEENYVLKGYRNRTITTKFGSVTFRRSYWYDADIRGYVTPLDTLLLIPRYKRFDEKLAIELAQTAAMDSSYDKTAKNSGISISGTTVRNMVKEIGSDENLQDVGAEKVSKPLKEVYVEADEDHIKTKDGKSRFLKLIYVHEGYEEIRKSRRRLINPHYFSGLYGGQANDELWQNIQNYIFNRYGSDVKVIFTSDGGNWLKAGKDFLQNCTHLLEYFHIAQACARITKGLDWNVGKKTLEALIAGDLETFEAIVNERLNRKITSGRKSRIRGQRNYLVGYLEEINLYGQGVSPGDSTEGHVSHCLSARFSSRPMAWSVEGANALVAVRMMCYNKINIFEIRKRSNLCERKAKRQDKLIAMDKRKLKKQTKNDKYYESLQTKFLTSNPRLNMAIVSAE